ncbi:FAD-dependent oxidoreductase [Brachyspira hyodysenteriae]|nr:FAD-dependent oxidoreductase [Brachyspira hyodysenteriae]MDA1468368.1 FAD-dependent oxidoreductase [Brachyspira hyodysenteriae]
MKQAKKYEYKADEEDGTFGVFIFVGYVPLTKLFEGKVAMQDGYILTDEEMKTNVEGVFACGDLRPKMLKQVITAAADGAIAGISANKYIEEKFAE